MLPKLSGACYANRPMVHTSNSITLEQAMKTQRVHTSNTDIYKWIYFAHFHCSIKYGVIFWGKSSSSGEIFTLLNKTVRIMAGA